MITLAVRYTVDHNKLGDFEAYVRALPAHIERCVRHLRHSAQRWACALVSRSD